MTNSPIIQEYLTEKEIEKNVLKPKKKENSRYSEKILEKYAGKLPQEIGTDYTYRRQYVWPNVIGFIILHLFTFYSFIRGVNHPLTTVWAWIMAFSAGEGVTMGAHRLYAHKAYKAHFIVRFALTFLQTIAGQNCMYIWVRDHRQHHKYSDTDADPHNANVSFFFSHMGWLMQRKHPAVIAKGRTIDMSDLEADPIVMFQMKYYTVLYILCAIVFPVVVPVWLWDEGYIESFLRCYLFRYLVQLHITWLVNSAAHYYGTKPYDLFIRPVESKIVTYLAMGEGWHNYHHAFPWDYRASELGTKYNPTTNFIDLLAYLGLAYDLKTAPEHMVKHRALKKGDGSHFVYGPMKTAKEAELANNQAVEETNVATKKDLEINHNEETETEAIFTKDKDAATGETNTVKRLVKAKYQAHG